MSKRAFEQIKLASGNARSGFLNTRAGRVRTPFFMPVATKGAVKGLTPEQVFDGGAQVLLSNTYHLHLQPGEAVVKKLGGLHVFTGWSGPILTDSGGFQVFSLANIRKITDDGVIFKDPKSGKEVLITPEKSMQIQIALGSDIIMAFDDLTGLSLHDRHRSKEALQRTHRWLTRCITEFNKQTRNISKGRTPKKGTILQRPLLFGIVQGGLNKKLRAQSLEFVQSQSVDGIAIGGLAGGETRREMRSMLNFIAPRLDPTRVRYLMGVGEPLDMRYAVKRGIDMFDCVLPTRGGRHGSAWINGDKKISLKSSKFVGDGGPINKKCDCATCKAGYSRAFLRHLFKSQDPLAGSLASVHNLRYLYRLCEEYQK